MSTSTAYAQAGRSAYLELSEYDLELCQRLALSPKTAPTVKRIARLLLEMHRYTDAACLSHRTGIAMGELSAIRDCYQQEGMQQVLAAADGLTGRLVLTRPLQLNEQERSFCRQVVTGHLGSSGRQRRAQALLLLDQGTAKCEAAAACALSERTLERLMERYRTYGAEGAVNDGARQGRPVRYPSEEFVPLIRRIVQQTGPESLLRWTMNDLRDRLAVHRREAASISSPTLRTLMRQAGLSFRQLGAH